MQWAEVDDMNNRLVRVATHASGQLLMESRRIFTDRRMPSTGARQPGSKAVGALNAPQPRTPPNMGGGDRAAPKAEAKEVVANILIVPEKEVPVRKHGSSRRCSRRVKRATRRTTRLHPNGGGEEVNKRVGVEPHVLEDMVQEDLSVGGSIQPGSDGPQGSQRTIH